MTTTTTNNQVGAAGASREATTAVTRSLLGYGVLAGPLWVTVAGVQAFTRDGFDVRRHAVSLLSNGDLGWIQTTSFLVAGLMTVAGAVGMRRALGRGSGGTWGPRLIGAYGLSLIAAGLFAADPMDGFPLGTPDGPPVAVSWHGILHMASAGLGFLALVAACCVFARRFTARGQRGWAVYSLATGVFFFGTFAALSSGTGQPVVTLAFYVAVVLAWTWITTLAARLYGGAR